MTENLKNTIEARFPTVASLTCAYMRNLKFGGIFAAGRARGEKLGREVVVEVVLPGADEAMATRGKVCWVSPQHCTNPSHIEGIGVAFDDCDSTKLLVGAIEKALGGRSIDARAVLHTF